MKLLCRTPSRPVARLAFLIVSAILWAGATGSLSAQGGWLAEDVGAVGVAGSSQEANGVITLQGSGADIWGATDAFHFRHRAMTGNGSLVARFVPGTGHGWAKVGLMIRENLTPGAKNVMVLATPGNHIGLQSRSAAGGTTAFVDGGWTGLPVWLMLDRVGNTYRAYRSYDGDNWTSLGSVTVDMPATVRVGFAVSSHNNASSFLAMADDFMQLTAEATATPTNLRVASSTANTVNLAWDYASGSATGFELERATAAAPAFARVSVLPTEARQFADTGLTPGTEYRYRLRVVGTGGSFSEYTAIVPITTSADAGTGGTSQSDSGGWVGGDIGAVGPAGSTEGSGNAFTLRAGGGDIWGGADALRMHYQPWIGDGTIVARVASLTNTHGWAKAGVMIRSSFDSTSANAAMLLTAANVCGFQTRATAGATTELVGGPRVNPAHWVKLKRVGNVFTGYISPNGVHWTQVGSKTVVMGEHVFIGVVASAHNPGNLTTAVFDGVELSSELPLPPPGVYAPQTWGNTTGSASEFGSLVTVSATGGDIWGSSDSGLLAAREWTGDVTITARSKRFDPADGWTKAGLMIRAADAGNAANAFVAITGWHGQVFQARTGGGAQTTSTPENGPTFDSWFRLVRTGNVFSGYASRDEGVTWTLLGSATIVMPATVKVGIAIASHNSGAMSVAEFSDIAVE